MRHHPAQRHNGQAALRRHELRDEEESDYAVAEVLCNHLSWRADRAVVRATVAKDYTALQYAAPELRADRAVVLAAVAQSG